MIQANDLPDTLALFPLPGALLLPRARLPLHIFEPRYLAMLEDVLKTPHRLIGMIQPVSEDAARLAAVGCAGRVTGFSESDDGRYMITLWGICRFHLNRELDGFPAYRRAGVGWAGFERDLLRRAEADAGFEREPFLNLVARYFAARKLETGWESLREAEPELLVNALSMLLPLDPEEKQALLEAPDLSARRQGLATLLEIALRSGGDEVMQ